MPNARSINLNQDFPSWYLVGVWEGYTHLSYNVTTPTDYYITFTEDSAEISYPDGRVENYCKYSTLGTDSNANDIGFYFRENFLLTIQRQGTGLYWMSIQDNGVEVTNTLFRKL
jgi:hypothetical protein